MPDDGVAVTGKGKLKCQKCVIHLAAPQGYPSAWSKIVRKCLQIADKLEIKSLSFPALGTGKYFIRNICS